MAFQGQTGQRLELPDFNCHCAKEGWGRVWKQSLKTDSGSVVDLHKGIWDFPYYHLESLQSIWFYVCEGGEHGLVAGRKSLAMVHDSTPVKGCIG